MTRVYAYDMNRTTVAVVGLVVLLRMRQSRIPVVPEVLHSLQTNGDAVPSVLASVGFHAACVTERSARHTKYRYGPNICTPSTFAARFIY
jgi:hypothetical protein